MYFLIHVTVSNDTPIAEILGYETKTAALENYHNKLAYDINQGADSSTCIIINELGGIVVDRDTYIKEDN